ncbi:MAG: serine hydrolase domain-containing protein [Anaerolineae bacterium]|jgi:CubicO group peptidase (beta-lactamase class C family)|nr:serine hydrolase [Chloroflexota bacterium]
MAQTLTRVSPESVGIPSEAVAAFVEAVQQKVGGLHSFMLLRHGQVAAEGWWAPYAPQRPHMLFSLSKSFAATAVGLAIEEGRLSLQDPVISFFPEETPSRVSRNLAAMTVHHLLSMNTGHHVDASAETFKRMDGNLVRRFLRIPVKHKPGSWFVYNTAATYILSAIVHKLTGMPLTAYLQPRLFDPLGIAPPLWDSDPLGINMGGFGLHLTTEDIARFGQLFLQEGRWGDRQLVPADWIRTAHVAHSDNSNQPGNPDWQQGYGYQMWVCRHGAYRGDGAFGQYCVVMPEQDAVLAATSGIRDLQAPLDALWELLLPAMAPAALPEDAAARQGLRARLEGLSIPPQQGQATSPIAEAVSGQMYDLEENAAGLTRVGIRVGARQRVTLLLRDRKRTWRLPVGAGQWAESSTRMPLSARDFGVEEPVLLSGGWTSPDTYAVQLCAVGTPFLRSYALQFTEAGLTLTVASNVGAPEPVIVRGIAAQKG